MIDAFREFQFQWSLKWKCECCSNLCTCSWSSLCCWLLLLHAKTCPVNRTEWRFLGLWRFMPLACHTSMVFMSCHLVTFRWIEKGLQVLTSWYLSLPRRPPQVVVEKKCQMCFWAHFLHAKQCRLALTGFLQMHWRVWHVVAPILTLWLLLSDSRKPADVMGGALSQLPAWWDLTAFNLALSIWLK